jgi:hypothetical protein
MWIAALLLSAAPLLANDIPLELKFAGPPSVELPQGNARKVPLDLRLEDGRAGNDPLLVGAHQDINGNVARVSATSDVLPFVSRAVTGSMKRRGVFLTSDAERVLSGKLRVFIIAVNDQQQRALYNADVSLAFDLQNRQGDVLWSGRVAGDTTIFARRFDDRSCNKMISDALTKALDQLMANAEFTRAWGTGQPAVVAAEPERGEPVSPQALLAAMKQLREDGSDADALVAYLDGKILSSPLSIADAMSWGDAGLPRRIIRVGLHLAVEDDPGAP